MKNREWTVWGIVTIMMTKLVPVFLVMGMVFIFMITQQETSSTSCTSTPNAQEDITVKKVALTYDDGPDPVYTTRLLEVLDQYQVKATFFLMGKAVKENPQVVKAIYDRGHSVGNHTYSHANLESLSLADARVEMEETSELIYQCTGEYPSLFRPPFGAYPKELEKKSNMVFVLWDVDPLDWQCQNTNRICRKVMKNVEENGIILMHDAYETTVEATRQLIPQLQDQGYEFVTVEELFLP